MSKIIFENNFVVIRGTAKSLIVTIFWKDAATQKFAMYHTKDFNNNTNFNADWNDYNSYLDRFLMEVKEGGILPYRIYK